MLKNHEKPDFKQHPGDGETGNGCKTLRRVDLFRCSYRYLIYQPLNSKTMNTIEKLTKFVNQRPRLDFADYGDYKAYNQESREITRDRSDYYELLGFARMVVNELDEKLTAELSNTSGRLFINNSGNIEYHTGQYFPTEYRPAACRVLSNLIWRELGKEYATGHEIRKAARRNVSRRVCRNYFN